jgi:hypothetical protein
MSESEIFYIWSMEHNAWWRPDSNGYTNKLSEAGTFGREECYDILFHANWSSVRTGKTPHEAMIPASTVERAQKR